MFDFGLLTLPAFAALSVFLFALFTGEDIAIDKINVPAQVEKAGYSSTTVTRRLTDHLRRLSERAASEVSGIHIDGGSINNSVSAFEEYFQLGLLVNGSRNLFGLIPYYVYGEIIEQGEKATFSARIFTKDKQNPVHVITVNGDLKNVDAMLQTGAFAILEKINPYILALYYRREELAAKQYDFPKTREMARKYLESRPVQDHYFIYGLLGRMHMLRAESAEGLSAAEREAELKTAMAYLAAAIKQKPEYLFPHVNMALIYEGKGEFALADKNFARAVEVQPDYEFTRKTWGVSLVKRERFAEAVVQLDAAVKLKPTDAASRALLAATLAKAGDRVRAKEQWAKAVELAPMNCAYRAKLDEFSGLQPDASCVTPEIAAR